MGSDEVTLNGRSTRLSGVATHTTALDWLRGTGLTGAKEGCAEGECGACAVLVARPGATTSTEWVALNSCLIPAGSLAGQEVVTVEGLGSPAALHPVQHELATRGGSQCGYCTPGFVCSMAAEYYRADRPDGEVDLDALSGNLCRCTGYRPIRDAARAMGTPAPDDPLATRRADPPPRPTAGHLTAREGQLVRPRSVPEALSLLADHPGAMVVAGCTDWGVEVNQRHARATMLVVIDRLADLRAVTVEHDAISIGAALSLTEVQRALDGRVPLLDQMLPRFASRLIRNAATIGGNLATASPIGDCAPVLLALDADVVLVGAAGRRVVPVAEFFTGYRRTALRGSELIEAVRIPLPAPGATWFMKVTKRWTDDISSVAVAFALDIDDGLVRAARVGLGGVAATPIRARSTEQSLVGRPWDAGTVAEAAAVLADEGTPMDDHRASAAYRRAMLGQSLWAFLASGSGRTEVDR